MTHRVFKSSYNQAALESWLSHLSTDWENLFDPKELELGRDFYRNRQIRSLELTERSAIASIKLNDIEQYCVIDWDRSYVIKVRGSQDSRLVSRSIAVAGLYEIEELLSNSISSFFKEKPTTKKVKNHEKPLPQKVQPKARDLHIRIEVQSLGVLFYPYWINEQGQEFKAFNEVNNVLNVTERGLLIQLSHLARKSKLKFTQKKAAYLLSDLSHLLDFIQKDWPQWLLHFQIDNEQELMALNKAPKELGLLAQAKEDAQNMDLEWSFYDEKEVFTQHEQEKLLKYHHRPIILPGRGVVSINEDQQNILSDWIGFKKQNKEIPKYILFSLFTQEASQIHLTGPIKEWRESLLSLNKDAQIPEFLRPYQKDGVHWLMHLCNHQCHALLADEMGLGKTLQVLTLLSQRPIKDKHHIIACPASVVNVWIREAEKFYPELVLKKVQKGSYLDAEAEPCIWVASYTQLRRHKDVLKNMDFGYVVLDEAQMIKNPEAKTTQACMSITADHRIAITGTPIENKHLDLWTLFRFLMPGLLGSKAHFLNQVEQEGIDKIKKQITPFILRRLKGTVAKDLPSKTEINIRCELTARQEEAYIQYSQPKDNEGNNESDFPKNGIHLFTLITRLRQACCDPGLLPDQKDIALEYSCKIQALIPKLTEILNSGHKVVIFSQFTQFLERIQEAYKQHLPQYQSFMLTGKSCNREQSVDTFQAHPDPTVFFVSLKAGGTGITLHAADYVFLMDPWWNPASENQAIDRIHRIGQTKPVTVYRMLTQGTIEDRIQTLKQEKQGIFDSVVGDISNMSQIKSYFKSLKELIELR